MIQNGRADQRSRRLASIAIATAGLVVSVLALASISHAGGPPAGTIYAHDRAYRTVATPRDLPNDGPFDKIYTLPEGLASVAESAPGDKDFNGGRWEVHEVTFVNIPPTQYTNAEDLLAAAERGDIQISDVVRRFECPLIPIPATEPR